MARPVNAIIAEIRAEQAKRRAAETALAAQKHGFETAQDALRKAGDRLIELQRELSLSLFEEE